MGAVKHAVRVVSNSGFAVPVRRQPPLLVGYEHFRLDRQGALLSPGFFAAPGDAPSPQLDPS